MAKILIVDDSPTEQAVLENILLSGGYSTVMASDAQEGIAKASSEQPDLILMDVVMPGMNGFQATRQISKDEATKSIPIIIVTSKNQETDRVWAIRQGASDFMTKPIDSASLLDKIKEILGS